MPINPIPSPEQGTWLSWEEMKPYPNEHAAGLKSLDTYKRFRPENDKFGGGIHAIWGVRKDTDKVELQGIRFDKAKHSVTAAKKWLKDHDYSPILFEPASGASIRRDPLQKVFKFKLDEEKGVTEEGDFWGHASVFNVLDLQQDIVMPGAFRRSLDEHEKAGSKVKMLWQHRGAEPIGTWPELMEVNNGLECHGKLVMGVQQAKECYLLLKAEALDGLSIGYETRKSERDEESGIRKLLDVDLWEISVVTFPANPAARVIDVRTIRELEDTLRDAGFSKRDAKSIASRGFEGLRQRDASLEAARKNLDELAAALKSVSDSIKKAK